MADGQQQSTAAEAAFVLREPVRAVRKALDEGPVRATLVRQPGGSVRAIARSDLIYLCAVRALRDELTPKARSSFYAALKQHQPGTAEDVRFGHLSVAIGDFESEVETRTRELLKLADKVEFRSDGEAILKGTGIEVHRIAALLDGGLSVEQVCEDYPSLDPAAVAAAGAYAEAHPKPGRPYPRITAKRALRGAGLEALDEVLGTDAGSSGG